MDRSVHGRRHGRPYERPLTSLTSVWNPMSAGSGSDTAGRPVPTQTIEARSHRKPSQEELQGMMPAEGTPQRMHRSFGSQHHLDIGGELYQIRPYSVLIREVEELTEKVEELERRKDAVEGFAAVAAHELMEPLVMTEAYAALIGSRLEGPQHADTLRDLDALGRGAARMRRLIETLLHDARSAGSPL